VLISHRCSSTYLVSIDPSSPGQVLQEYQTSQSKGEEVLCAGFNSTGNYVYAYSTTKNLYIYDRKTGKLLSLLIVPSQSGISDEVSSLVIGSDESMIAHSRSELFKLE
jgi:WD40 repeat protein